MADEPTEPSTLRNSEGEPHSRAAALEAAFRSDQLAELRQLIDQVKALKELIGPLAQFRFVVDANILLYQVLWPLRKRRKPDARTDLQETIAAGTILLYATPQVVAEVDRDLPELGVRYGLATEACEAAWSKWKAVLLVREADPALMAEYVALGPHPADAPTVALAKGIEAHGVLSRDKHIKQMGGTSVQMDFVLELRNYSRRIVVSAYIRVGGCFFTLGALGAVAGAVSAVRTVCLWFAKLPDQVKLLAGAALVVMLVHPTSRERMFSAISSMGKAARDALPVVLQVIAEVAEVEARNRVPVPALPT